MLTLALLGAFLLADPAAQITRDVEFARPGGTPLLMDVSIPEGGGPHPAVILVHGGGWEAGDKSTYIKPWFPMLTDARFAWFSINYRLAPLHPHPAAVRDIEAAITFIRDHARSYRIDPAKIALMGESAGGHLAALVGSRAESTLAAVVSFYGIHDIPLWAEQRGRMPENIAQYLAGADPLEASPVKYIRKSMPPHLFVHGTRDAGVPIEQSTSMCERMTAAGARCEVFRVEGAPHGVENWEKNPQWQGYKPKVVQWLKEVLR
jgi:alpha-L-fucosidase 2